MMRILDLFCGAGGAAMGLHQAFPDAEIVGVDIRPQPRYPFTFVMADALTFPLDGYEFVWASPPCQGYSIMRNLSWLKRRTYPMLIAPIRERLRAWGGPYVIENVMGARRHMPGAAYLCGTMFGLPFYRHRLFEANFAWLAPAHPRHEARVRGKDTVGGRSRDIVFRPPEQGGMLRQPTVKWGLPRVLAAPPHLKGVALVRWAMGIDWMTGAELAQAIPPAYSRYLAQFVPLSSRRAA